LAATTPTSWNSSPSTSVDGAPIAAARIASSSMPETRSSVEDQRCETAELSSRTETGLYAAKTTVAT
jgi:hypothetical protein